MITLVGEHPTTGAPLTWSDLRLAAGCRIVLRGADSEAQAATCFVLAQIISDTTARTETALASALDAAKCACEWPAPAPLFKYRQSCEAYWPNTLAAAPSAAAAENELMVVGAALGASFLF
jgi:hypothetical protein